MSTPEAVIVVCLVLLGVAHSVLGESDLLKPLFAVQWKIEKPRWAVEKIFRFAWHLTSIAWFALAGIVAGANPLAIVGIMSTTSAAIIFVMLRGHLAWPLFLLAGLASFYAEGWLGSNALALGTIVTIAVISMAAAVHVYWAFGGMWMLDRALPKIETGFSPGPAITLAVAGALATFGAFVALVGFGSPPTIIRWAVAAGIAVLTFRAIGDNKVVGFTKQDHSSPFGQADDRYFTPLVVVLALGATGALL